jgi:SAM-dependent methyltransferase
MIDDADLVRLHALSCNVKLLDTGQALQMLPGTGNLGEVVEEFGRSCVLHHAGILVFPDDVAEIVDFLRLNGFTTRAPIPSTVVRSRLAARHRRDGDSLPVTILSAALDGRGGNIEVFVLPGLRDRERDDGIAARERKGEFETHVAFETSPGSLRTAQWLIADRMGLVPDGGGYNPFEQADDGGRSVFYYAARRDGTRPRAGAVHRLELFCTGHQELALNEHLGRTVAAGQEARLFELITGHWATQAMSVAAELGLADVLAYGPMTGEQVAAATGCAPQALTRLLRYLTGLGVVGATGDRFSGTPLLDLVRQDSPFRDLTLMYGGEFYQAWGAFGHAVRTGESAFGQVFGLEHFDYFQQHAEVGERFTRSMAATTQALADRLGWAFDFSSARNVIDVGGGDGTLLRRILELAPEATGVLFDRKNVVADAGAAIRMSIVEGDFFEEVPAGGDLYVLSRILHDWDDERCATLLDRCREACAPGGTLLVVERVLPDEPVPSPAFAWDLQMLAITGGRERTRGEYSRLLAAAGFELETVTTVWHGLSLLAAKVV